MDPVDAFAAEAETFLAWARSGTDAGEQAARAALAHLMQLYQAALSLPGCRGLDLEDDEDTVRPDDQQEWDEVLAAAGRRLPLDFYGVVFDPLVVPPGAPCIGSLCDDIADVYRDVAGGLHAYRAGRRAVAAFDWSHSLQSHWGAHATGAIRALHWWLSENADNWPGHGTDATHR